MASAECSTVVSSGKSCCFCHGNEGETFRGASQYQSVAAAYELIVVTNNTPNVLYMLFFLA